MKAESYDIIYSSEDAHWWYKVRREMVRDILSEYTGKKDRPLRILDIGCGTGLLMRDLGQFGTVQGIDSSPLAIEYCKKRGLTNVSLASATSLPFDSNSFDVVVILDVLEHLEDDGAGCRELARVLDTGGIAIITTPAFMFLWSGTDVLGQHYRRYTRNEIRNKVSAAHMKIQRTTYFNTLLFPAILFVRLCVRLLNIPMRAEAHIGGSVGNTIFYYIFHIESILLRWGMNFPFGVSILVLAEK
jgi:2-polyprenyl-3-methyl-5-hydroxy-6-metoxy-1,4-benzoquinol methylase